MTDTKQQHSDARDLLEGELHKLLDPADRFSVTVEAFQDFMPVDELMADPLSVRYMLVVRFWRYIDGQKYMVRHVISPQMVLDTLALPTFTKTMVAEWAQSRDKAIRDGAPE